MARKPKINFASEEETVAPVVATEGPVGWTPGLTNDEIDAAEASRRKRLLLPEETWDERTARWSSYNLTN